jgi:hypothetical protein
MLERGTSIPDVGPLMDWSASTMILIARRYGHISQQLLRDAVNSISASPKKVGKKRSKRGEIPA